MLQVILKSSTEFKTGRTKPWDAKVPCRDRDHAATEEAILARQNG